MKALNPIDQMVGRRIKERRQELKMGRRALASSLEVTTEEIDRYEDGVSRVSAAQLFSLTRLLDVRANYFFQPFDEPVEPTELGLGTPMNR